MKLYHQSHFLSITQPSQTIPNNPINLQPSRYLSKIILTNRYLRGGVALHYYFHSIQHFPSWSIITNPSLSSSLPLQKKKYQNTTNLFLRDCGYVTVVNVSRVLLDLLGIALAFELLAGEPERYILIAVLAEEELPEELAARLALHQLVEGRAPRPDLLEAALRVEALDTVTRVAQLASKTVLPDARVPLLLPLIARASCAPRASANRLQTVNRSIINIIIIIIPFVSTRFDSRKCDESNRIESVRVFEGGIFLKFQGGDFVRGFDMG